MDLTPIYRIEHFLDAIVNNSVNPYSPEFRVEYYLAKIAGENVTIPEPIYRKEFYLAYLCGEEVELPDPIYRIEYYLAFLCGLDVELPEPIYRVEFWLWDWCGGGGIEKTVTGNPIHILDALAKPAQALSVKLEPIQDLHGYDSPWPAGGGKNIADIQGFNVPASVQEQVSISSALTLPAGTYTLSFTLDKTVTATRNRPLYSVGSADTYSNADIKTAGRGSWTFTLAEETTLTFKWWAHTVSEACVISEVQLELGSTATSFAPYSNICPISGHTDADVIVSPTLNPSDGTTYPIPLGQTVYGGTLDVLTGVLTVDRVNYNASDLTWSIRSGVGRFLSSTLVSTIKKPAQDSEYLNGFICSSYKADSYSDTDVNGNIGVSDAGRICICNTAFDQDLSGFTASLTGVTIIVPLATPQTIQLTPTQVELLIGENNIWSDGEMTLVYLADGNASDEEALNILLGGRYVNNHGEDEPTDREALNIILGGNER